MRTIDRLIKEENLFESGIKIPKGTRAAKIMFHKDMDGFFSALLTYNQLIKQGINPKHIKLDMLQYGDTEDTGSIESSIKHFKDKFEKEKDPVRKRQIELRIKGLEEKKDKESKTTMQGRMSKSKGQMVSVVDFAAIPEEGESPDFWSDHHVPKEEWIKKQKEGKGGGKVGATEYGSDTEHLATVSAQGLADYNTIKAVTQIDSAKYTNLMDAFFYSKDFVSKGRMERLATLIDVLIVNLIKKNPNAVYSMIKETKPSLVHVYNNLKKYSKLTDLQNKAIKELAKEEPNWKVIDSIRNQMPSMEMAKDIKKGSKPFDLRNLKSTMKKNLQDLEDAKTGYFEPKWQEELDRIEKEHKDLKEKLKEYKKTKKSTDKEQYEKGLEELNKKIEELKKRIDIGKEKKKEMKGRFVAKGNVMKQDITALRKSTARYLGTLLKSGGERKPFIFKRYPTMIQIALNPDIDKSKIQEVDLNKDMADVLTEIKKKFQNKYNEWSFNIIDKSSGGHKAITNISGLGTIGLLNKAEREELKELKDLENRAKALKSHGFKMEEKMPEKYKRLQFLEEKKTETAKKRKQIMDEIENMFLWLLNKKYAEAKVTKEVPEKMSIKESILKEYQDRY
jgi:hypothetical protein